MTLSQQCVSLHIAKRLKELGVKQDSAFYWINQVKEEMKSRKIVLQPSDSWLVKLGTAIGVSISAFTASELGEMLPQGFQQIKGTASWTICYADHFESADTEIDARGKMYCYLLENGLIKNV